MIKAPIIDCGGCKYPFILFQITYNIIQIINENFLENILTVDD